MNDSDNQAQQPKAPGDEVAPGTSQSAPNTCPRCEGTGRIESEACTECAGTGQVTVLVGDA